MVTISKSKEILRELISKGIEFKLHNELPVIYSKDKVDPELFKIAKKYREGIAKALMEEKKMILEKYMNSNKTEKHFFKIILEEKFNMKL
ncbi:MAG: hypothetical protein VX523_00605 [Chloroflexota bacterium]|nr:hypothetical protein [Chloroflexota bacterium]